jgi:hypothetical protein
MAVMINGSALTADPYANPQVICNGDSTQLFSLANGGTGVFNYTWTSDPPGFTSSLANPVVNPGTGTIYFVDVTDGFNSASGSVGVTVNQNPIVNLGNDTTVCVFDTITIDAGDQGANYIWSNGSTERTISVGATGIGFDSKQISVTVISSEGCETVAYLNVAFDFTACTGIDDDLWSDGLSIYPNPGNGLLNIEYKGGHGILEVSVIDGQGRFILKNHKLVVNEAGMLVALDLRNNPEGIYLIRVEMEGEVQKALKYILNK